MGNLDIKQMIHFWSVCDCECDSRDETSRDGDSDPNNYDLVMFVFSRGLALSLSLAQRSATMPRPQSTYHVYMMDELAILVVGIPFFFSAPSRNARPMSCLTCVVLHQENPKFTFRTFFTCCKQKKY